jgi:4-hydroxythreonine-4-phosphate dehydrogenase
VATRKPTVGITLGDPWGIGPEVIAATLSRSDVRRACRAIVYGDRETLERAAAIVGVRLPASLDIVAIGPKPSGAFGRPPRGGGRIPIGYLEAAVAAARAGELDALCTGPIHKGLVVAAGFRHTGHTDYLAERLGAPRVVMLLAGPTLRVALATVHVPLRSVPRLLSIPGLVATLAVLERGLRRYFGLARPRIAVCGLNPHAGEGGLLGGEEAAIIAPAVRRARKAGIRAEGPLPADSLFAQAIRTKRWDAILAMAHDQGLGPLKAVDFERAVNVTLGLCLPRTSPDHGVAYDIAGTGRADPTSMIEAVLAAARMVGAPKASGSRARRR